MLRFYSQLNAFSDTDVFFLHYNNDGGEGGEGGGEGGEGGGDGGEGGSGGGNTPKGRFMTDDEINKIVIKRSEKARTAQKEALARLEQIQETVRMTDEEKSQLEDEVEKLRKATLTAEEIRKREAKKIESEYSDKLTAAEQEAKRWKTEFENMFIENTLSSAALENKALKQAIPQIVASLRPAITLEERKNDEGKSQGFEVMIDFADVGAEGQPVQTRMDAKAVLKRMKELPEQYGHLFEGPQGGLGGSNGQPGAGKKGFRSGMSMAEYEQFRIEQGLTTKK